jgi:hypothetical protein
LSPWLLRAFITVMAVCQNPGMISTNSYVEIIDRSPFLLSKKINQQKSPSVKFVVQSLKWEGLKPQGCNLGIKPS